MDPFLLLCSVGRGEGDNRGEGGYVSELIKSKHASENFWMENANQQGMAVRVNAINNLAQVDFG